MNKHTEGESIKENGERKMEGEKQKRKDVGRRNEGERGKERKG